MSAQNHARLIVSLLREICSARGISLTSFCGDWIFDFRRGPARAQLFGYDFSLNTATARAICKDKAATSAMLAHAGVPHIPHWLFHTPEMAAYVPHTGNWNSLLNLLAAHPGGLVCKPNEGTGGNHVRHVKTTLQLEAAVSEIFAVTRALCVSPFVSFDAEYRVAILRADVEFIYQKRRPVLTGDGRQTVRALLLARLAGNPWTKSEFEALSDSLAAGLRLDDIPPAGALVPLHWKHNLGHGSAPELLPLDAPAAPPLIDLARRAADAVDVAVASVDIAATAGGPRIMEINSGIMMESLVAALPEGRTLARHFYDRILCAALNLDP